MRPLSVCYFKLKLHREPRRKELLVGYLRFRHVQKTMLMVNKKGRGGCRGRCFIQRRRRSHWLIRPRVRIDGGIHLTFSLFFPRAYVTRLRCKPQRREELTYSLFFVFVSFDCFSCYMACASLSYTSTAKQVRRRRLECTRRLFLGQGTLTTALVFLELELLSGDEQNWRPRKRKRARIFGAALQKSHASSSRRLARSFATSY